MVFYPLLHNLQGIHKAGEMSFFSSLLPFSLATYAFTTSSRTNIIRKLIVSKMHETQMPFSA